MAERGRREYWRALEVFALTGLAISQPLFTVFGASPEVFVFADASTADIVWFALIIVFVPPLILWGFGALVGLAWKSAREPVHLVTLTLLASLVPMHLVKHYGWRPGLWLIALGLTAGALLFVAYRRSTVTQSLLHYLAIGPVVFLAGFLLFSPTGDLMRPTGAEAASLDLAAPEELPPVVVIVFDEWPLTSIVDGDGAVDAELYPNLARLAGDSTWYRNATTVSNSTLFAVPSILTGNLPEPGLSADARSHPENLFTLLGGAYTLEAVEPVTRLCPAAICNEPEAPEGEYTVTPTVADGALATLLGDAVDLYRTLIEPIEVARDTANLEEAETRLAAEIEPAVDDVVSDARNDDGEVNLGVIFEPRPAGLNGLLSTFAADEAPTLHFLHLLLPHTPYNHVASGERYSADEALREVAAVDGSAGGNLRSGSKPAAALERQRMLHQVGYLDGLVGDLLDELERTGLYDESLIVLTADHGIAFEPGAPARGLGPDPMPDSTMADMGWVPLIVKAPGQAEGAVDDRNALTIDVVPTVADLLHIRMPWTVDGRSLEGPPRNSEDKPLVRAVGSAYADYRLEPPVLINEQASLDDVLARGVDRYLPPDVAPDRWYASGPRPDLLGLPVQSLPSGDARGYVATIETGSSVSVVPGADLPAIATARLDGDVPDGTVVAVAVDGTIAAVTPTYTDEGGSGRIAALLLRSLLTDGSHEVTLYTVGGDEGSTLGPIALG